MDGIKRRRLGAGAMRGVVARFASSGMTVGAFCRREGISASSFYRWRSKGASAPERLPVPREHGVGSREHEFIELGALRPAGERIELRLDLGGGLQLQLVRG